MKLTLGLSSFWYPRRVKGLCKEWGLEKSIHLFPHLKSSNASGSWGCRKGSATNSTCRILLSFVYGEKEKKKMLFSCKCSTRIITAPVYMLIYPGWRPWGLFPFLSSCSPPLLFPSPPLPSALLFPDIFFSFYFYPFSFLSFFSSLPFLLCFCLSHFSLPFPLLLPPTSFFKEIPIYYWHLRAATQQEGTAPRGCMLCSTDVAEPPPPPPVLHLLLIADAQVSANTSLPAARIHQWWVNYLTTSQFYSLISQHTNEAGEAVLPGSGHISATLRSQSWKESIKGNRKYKLLPQCLHPF